jgi:hypothetical protein
MKAWCVVKLDMGSLYDMGVPNVARGAVTYAYAAVQNKSERAHDFDGNHSVYFTDTAEAAEIVAKYLAERNPTSTWVVAKNTCGFKTSPGPVSKGVFSDKGYFPG